MHGTYEWLPGSSLGSTADSWPEILIGDMPNLYVYAANNPSESLLAKRRGFAALVSHNVPPYSRAGSYKELAAIKELIADYQMERSSTTPSVADDAKSKYTSLIPILSGAIERAGLYDDVPFLPSPSLSSLLDSSINSTLTAEMAVTLLEDKKSCSLFAAEYSAFIAKVSSYLAELEQRLFSEGLHEIGGELTVQQLTGYLNAVLEGSNLSDDLLQKIAELALAGLGKRGILMNLWDEKSVVDSAETLALRRSVADNEGALRWKAFWKDDWRSSKYSGLHFRDFFSQEDLFGLFLLSKSTASLSERLQLFAQYQSLRLQRSWGLSDEAESKISDILTLVVAESAARSKGDLTTSSDGDLVSRAVDLALALRSNGDAEMKALVRAVAGEYISAGPGGDVIRDGTGILPTGRNIYSLDPYRIPSSLALLRGAEAVDQILTSHKASNGGSFPETVAVTLWGLDTIKTKGESVAMVLALVGAQPLKEATGRIVGFELIPLEELGRPRVDVLCSLSGIFRDSFANVIDLLDSLFEKAAEADEPEHLNYVRKHVQQLRARGVARPTARLFSNPPGEFGSMVNEQIGTGEWADGAELGRTWESRNSFSYGSSNSGERGVSRPELLKVLLNTTDRIIQEVDSVEYGLTDIQEYYANTGAIKKAAENNRAGRRVAVTVVEAVQKKVRPRELEETLRMEYRSKFLNPKWSEAMVKQGAAGAYEISGRMTAMIGWAGTADFKEKWVFDGAAER